MAQPHLVPRQRPFHQPIGLGYTEPLPIRSDFGNSTGYVIPNPRRRRMPPQQTPDVDRRLEQDLRSDGNRYQKRQKESRVAKCPRQIPRNRRHAQGQHRHGLRHHQALVDCTPLRTQDFGHNWATVDQGGRHSDSAPSSDPPGNMQHAGNARPREGHVSVWSRDFPGMKLTLMKTRKRCANAHHAESSHNPGKQRPAQQVRTPLLSVSLVTKK